MNNNRGRGRSNSTPGGRGPQSWRSVSANSSIDPHTPAGDNQSSNGRISGSSERKSHFTWQALGHGSGGSASKHPEDVSAAGKPGQRQGQSSFSGDIYFRGGKAKQWKTSSKGADGSEFGRDIKFGQSSVQLQFGDNDKERLFTRVLSELAKPSSECVQEGSSLNLSDMSRSLEESAVMNSQSEVKGSESGETDYDKEILEGSIPIDRFDICPPKSGFVLKPSLLAKNREKRNDIKRSVAGPNGIILRSGMVLLKNYLSSSEQVDIIKTCRTHGLGPAGFIQPRFHDGGKLHLKLMCFGEFWDPETSKYGVVRPIDRAKPPSVPQKFLQLVDRAIKDSHSLIKAQDSWVRNVEEILPPVKPDICLVNYYTKTGRLGLHQDKDEGRESLGKGIPIVSFSIGDSAEFLYGDQKDAETAEKIILESGDVLIFGGKSRHIFHGVPAILPDTAPKSLLEETNFLPGRINLTFRQHL